MDDALPVRRIERVRYLDAERQHRFGFHRSPRNPVLQRHPVEKLHGDERLAILFTNLVDRADVGMVEGGRSLSLTMKTRQRLRVLGDLIGQEFQGDKAMQPVSSAL